MHILKPEQRGYDIHNARVFAERHAKDYTEAAAIAYIRVCINHNASEIYRLGTLSPNVAKFLLEDEAAFNAMVRDQADFGDKAILHLAHAAGFCGYAEGCEKEAFENFLYEHDAPIHVAFHIAEHTECVSIKRELQHEPTLQEKYFCGENTPLPMLITIVERAQRAGSQRVLARCYERITSALKEALVTHGINAENIDNMAELSFLLVANAPTLANVHPDMLRLAESLISEGDRQRLETSRTNVAAVTALSPARFTPLEKTLFDTLKNLLPLIPGKLTRVHDESEGARKFCHADKHHLRVDATALLDANPHRAH